MRYANYLWTSAIGKHDSVACLQGTSLACNARFAWKQDVCLNEATSFLRYTLQSIGKQKLSADVSWGWTFEMTSKPFAMIKCGV